ncbi:hypothetical protein HPP92_006421 [Vanilla planifolia]|uniref:DUF7803 domain-containing protein n=1 Tax=Vanilla planifolia TaxID=51239 RepID=A0A835RVV6_VANPL|nr:hypothetical protein HPP92_006421 [Vanilla planifolia]
MAAGPNSTPYIAFRIFMGKLLQLHDWEGLGIKEGEFGAPRRLWNRNRWHCVNHGLSVSANEVYAYRNCCYDTIKPGNIEKGFSRFNLLGSNHLWCFIAIMDVDSQPTMEETILVGDDLMLGPPSPHIPPEIASHVLEGVDLCDGILRNLFLCIQINDIEPFCQDEIVLYRQCAERRDKLLRRRLQESEHKLGLVMPLEQAKEREAQLQGEITSLERRMILASGVEGIEGFRLRWSLHGRLEDTRKRLESLNQGVAQRKGEPVEGAQGDPVKKKWFFW